MIGSGRDRASVQELLAEAKLTGVLNLNNLQTALQLFLPFFPFIDFPLKNLWMSSNNLTGVPPSVGTLRSLETLQLIGNRVTSLPDEIGNLAKLRELRLEKNCLQELPASIGSLRELKKLSVYINFLRSLPDEIGGLISLEELRLENNQLQAIPVSIGNLVNLSFLTLQNNPTLCSIPDSVGSLRNLRVLSMENCSLGSLPSSIGNLVHLQTLQLDSNRLNFLPASIGRLTSLQVLRAERNQLTVLPREIGRLSSLRELWLSDNELRILPKELGWVFTLKVVRVDRTPLVFPPPSSSRSVSDTLKYLREKPEPDENVGWEDALVGAGCVGKTSVLMAVLLSGKTPPLTGSGGVGKLSVLNALVESDAKYSQLPSVGVRTNASPSFPPPAHTLNFQRGHLPISPQSHQPLHNPVYRPPERSNSGQFTTQPVSPPQSVNIDVSMNPRTPPAAWGSGPPQSVGLRTGHSTATSSMGAFSSRTPGLHLGQAHTSNAPIDSDVTHNMLAIPSPNYADFGSEHVDDYL
eukprot:Rmarinus@m.8163